MAYINLYFYDKDNKLVKELKQVYSFDKKNVVKLKYNFTLIKENNFLKLEITPLNKNIEPADVSFSEEYDLSFAVSVQLKSIRNNLGSILSQDNTQDFKIIDVSAADEYGINFYVIETTQAERFKEIADAIREKTKTQELIAPIDFAKKIKDISTGIELTIDTKFSATDLRKNKTAYKYNTISNQAILITGTMPDFDVLKDVINGVLEKSE